MKLKLDENLDVRLVPLAAEAGHDVTAVLLEGLSGRTDEMIYGTCLREGRTLITLDLDFANPVRFPPGPTQGIVVLRPPRPGLGLIRTVFAAAIRQLKADSPRGVLWIAEPGRIRVYEPGRHERS